MKQVARPKSDQQDDSRHDSRSRDLVCRFESRGRLTHANESLCRFLGIAGEELLGRYLREFVPSADRLHIRRQLRMLSEGRGSSVDVYRIIDRDRRPRWIRWVSRVIVEDDGSRQIQSVGHDVTAQREAELAVAESEQRFRVAAECATDLIYERSFDGTVLNWFGVNSPHSSLNIVLPHRFDAWLDMIDVSDRDRVCRLLDDHLKSGEPYEIEYRLVENGTHVRHVVDRGSITFNELGEPNKWIGAIDDVTESRNTERQLRENQVQLNRRLSLERAIGELSTRLHSSHDATTIVEVIVSAFSRIGSILRIDRACSLELSTDGTRFSRVHEWDAADIPPRQSRSRNLATETFHDLFDAWAAGEVIHANRIADVEPRFSSLARYMERAGVQSIVAAPMFHEQRLGGVLVLECERHRNTWLEEDLRQIQTTAEIIGRAIGNLRNRERILQTNRKLESLDKLSRALSGYDTLDGMLDALTGITREIFEAERTILVFPCDPTARNIQIRRQAVAPNRSSINNSEHDSRESLVDIINRCAARPAMEREPYIFASNNSGTSIPRMCIILHARIGKPWLLCVDGADGSALWNEVDGELFMALAERAVDALSEALLLEQLRENELRLDEAQGVAHIGSWEADWSDARLWWSTEVFNIYQVDPCSFDGTLDTLYHSIHPDDQGVVRTAVQQSLDTRRACDITYRLCIDDAPVKYVQMRCITRYDQDGNALRSIGTIQDVSAAKRFEDALRQTQKLEAVGQLTGGIAHDFNNLLSIILGNLELVMRDAGDDRDSRFIRRVDTARRAAQRGADLTRKLLSVSRKNESRPTQIDMNRILVEMEELISRSLTPQVHVRSRLDPDLKHAIVDPGGLQDALLNLVINARDAMPAGGELVISTRNLIKPRSSVASNDDQHPEFQVCISVTDSGVGMKPEVVERALEPFFTTKAPGKGTGLGLAMVYAFVTQAGGHMDIDSTPGQGTRVNLFLPAEAEHTDPDPVPVIAGPGLVGGSEKILIVDDETELVELAEELLHDLGYQTVTAHNANDALQQLEADPDIDLLFSDILMPGGMDGYQLAAQTRRRFPRIRILLCSGYAERPADATEDAFTGIVLRKPYQVDDLCEALRRTIEGEGAA